MHTALPTAEGVAGKEGECDPADGRAVSTRCEKAGDANNATATGGTLLGGVGGAEAGCSRSASTCSTWVTRTATASASRCKLAMRVCVEVASATEMRSSFANASRATASSLATSAFHSAGDGAEQEGAVSGQSPMRRQCARNRRHARSPGLPTSSIWLPMCQRFNIRHRQEHLPLTPPPLIVSTNHIGRQICSPINFPLVTPRCLHVKAEWTRRTSLSCSSLSSC